MLDDRALLEDLQHRCDVLLWCTGLPLEWRGIIQCMVMAGHGIRDLWPGGMESLAQEYTDDSDEV